MTHLEKFLLYLEQTIQASGGAQETDKRQMFLSKDMEEENMNMRGFYRDQIKSNISKPNLEQIKSLSKEYKKIEKEIKQNENEKDSPTLFSPIITRKSLGNRNKQQMRNDLLQVYNQLQDIKDDSALNDKYRQNLKIVLKKFFTFGKIASRYVILPLSSQIPSDSLIRALNTSENKQTDIFNYTVKYREIITDAIDTDIKKYMTDNGYHFKNDDDIYDNVCYTKNNAKINLKNELAKIGANVKNIDNKKKILEKMDQKNPSYQAIVDEIKRLSEYSEDYFERMVDIIDSSDVDPDEKNLKVVVLSWVPRQILTQSTGTIWRSCMSLPHASNKYEAGSNVNFVGTGISEGVFIAWLVNLADMKTIKEPIARILIKPFMDNKKNIIWWPSVIYHDGRDGNELNLFKRVCNAYMLKKQKELITKDMKISIKDPQKVYSDPDNDRNKEIIFYNRNLEVEKFINAVDLTPVKVIDFITKSNINILNDNNYTSLYNYVLKTKSVSLMKLFVDKYLAKVKTNFSTNSNFIDAINDDIESKNNFLQFDESFYSILFKKIIQIFPTFSLSSDLSEKIVSKCFESVKKNNFILTNQLFETVKGFATSFSDSPIEHYSFYLLNIINNKKSWPNIIKIIKDHDHIMTLLYFYNHIEQVKSFFDLYFKEEMIKEKYNIKSFFTKQPIRKQNIYDITIEITENISKNKNIKNIKINLMEKIIDFDLFDKLDISKFSKLFNLDLSFIDDNLLDKMTNAKVFEKLIKNNPTDNVDFLKFFTLCLETKNRKLISYFIEVSMIRYLTKHMLLAGPRLNVELYYTIQQNLDLFKETVSLAIDINKNEKIKVTSVINYINLCKTQNLVFNTDKTFEKLINAIDDTDGYYNKYNLYLLLVAIKYKKIDDFAKNKKIVINDLAKNAHDKNIISILEIPDIDISAFLLKLDEFNVIRENFEGILNEITNLNLTFKQKMEIVIFILKQYYHALDFKSVNSIFYASYRRNTEEDQKKYNEMYEYLLRFVKEKISSPDDFMDNNYKIDMDFVRALSSHRSSYARFEWFIVKLMYPNIEDFLKSKTFKTMVSKANISINRSYGQGDTNKHTFLTNIRFVYNKKIEDKMIPAAVLKTIKANKFLNNSLEEGKRT